MAAVVSNVLELIRQRNWKKVKQLLTYIPAPDMSELLFQVDEHERGLIFRYLDREDSGEVFSHLEPEQQDLLLHSLTNQETRHLLATMPPDDRTSLLSELPSKVTRRLLGLLNNDDLEEARMLLGYPEESVGRIMTPDYVRVRENWTISQAIEHVRFYGKDSETINVVYVIDDNGVFLHCTRLRTLILADPEDLISEHLEYHKEIALSALADREEAVMLMQKYDLVALPVIDSENELVGIVTFDDIMDVAEEEATEDMLKTASVNPLKKGYHRARVVDLYSKRVGWLVILVVLSIFSSHIIAGFEEELAKMTILFAFVPLLLGAGGNAGSQASTLVIRALVTGDIEFGDIVTTVIKELAVGFLLGVSLGLVAALISFFRADQAYEVALAVGLSMTVIVMTANLIGMSFPFVLSKVGIDPAVASAPLIATLTDVTGLIIYFSIAVLIFNL